MYVCICNAVTDRAILEAAAEGVSSLNELTARTGAADCCGSCADDATRLLQQAHSPEITPLTVLPMAARPGC